MENCNFGASAPFYAPQESYFNRRISTRGNALLFSLRRFQDTCALCGWPQFLLWRTGNYPRFLVLFANRDGLPCDVKQVFQGGKSKIHSGALPRLCHRALYSVLNVTFITSSAVRMAVKLPLTCAGKSIESSAVARCSAVRQDDCSAFLVLCLDRAPASSAVPHHRNHTHSPQWTTSRFD